MGFTLRADIFGPRAIEEDWFREYAIQATVLFRPADAAFARLIREQFTRLDRVTGGSLVFFTVLDPPQDWLEDAKVGAFSIRRLRRSREIDASLSGNSLTLEDSLLVHEVARRFGVRWDEMPVLIASSNLWRGEFAVAGTDPGRLLPQLETLAVLARSRARPPSLLQIGETLFPLVRSGLLRFFEDGDWTDEPSDVPRRIDTGPKYSVSLVERSPEELAIAKDRRPSGPEELADEKARRDRERQESLLRRSLTGVLSWVQRALPARASESTDERAGELLLLAAAWRRGARSSSDAASFGLPAGLDDETYVLVQEAHLLGRFLGQLGQGASTGSLDLSPATVGIRKAMEKEVNRSLVQAARMARGVPMPDFFLAWCSLPFNPMVDTGEDRLGLARQVDLNDGPPLRFLTLGEALHAVQSMLRSPTERLAEVITAGLGAPMPPRLLRSIARVNGTCNRALHAGAPPVSSEDFDKLWARALSPDLLDPLCRLSSALRAGPRLPVT